MTLQAARQPQIQRVTETQALQLRLHWARVTPRRHRRFCERKNNLQLQHYSLEISASRQLRIRSESCLRLIGPGLSQRKAKPEGILRMKVIPKINRKIPGSGRFDSVHSRIAACVKGELLFLFCFLSACSFMFAPAITVSHS